MIALAQAPALPAVLKSRTVLEFFAGIGLVGMGLERAGWRMAFANDIDPQKFEIFQGQFSELAENYLIEDVHALAKQVERVPTAALATASFPCNDLSLAGARRGLKGEQSSAFWGFAAVLENLGNRRPPIVMLENVVGFLSSHGGKDFLTVLKELNRLGYAVDAFIVDASHFVPQSRQRLFVVGKREPVRLRLADEMRSFFESELRPAALARVIIDHPEINWSIRRLPIPPIRTKTLADIVQDLPDDASDWWSEQRAEYLLNQMSPKHRATADEMMARNQWSYGTVFRRMRSGKSMAELRTDGVAGCLRTPRGGSGRQIIFKAGFGRYGVRLLTGREAARLMGADEFRLTVPLNQALFGFGDAVCVDVIAWIAEHYLNPLAAELEGTLL